MRDRNSFTVHDLPLDERPRERLLKLGGEALSAQEILALILGRGGNGESVMVTAQRLLSHFGNLRKIAAAPIQELVGIKGIGLAKAAQLKAAGEMGKRLEDEGQGINPVIKSPEAAFNYVKGRLKGKKKEHFLVLCMDTRKRLIACNTISVGSLDTSLAHPREVFRDAISASSASVIFVHNHPSGSTEPSREDIELTHRLVKAGEVIGIEVVDHVIVCDSSYLSLKSRQLL